MRGVAIGLSLMFLAACGLFEHAQDSDEYRDRLHAWQESDPERYRWTVIASEPIFGPRPMTIVVEEGSPVRANDGTDKLGIEGVNVEGRPGTVDALIDWLIEYAPDAKSVNVEWASAGYPSKIELDHSDAIDDEISFRVAQLVPLDEPS